MTQKPNNHFDIYRFEYFFVVTSSLLFAIVIGGGIDCVSNIIFWRIEVLL